MELKSLFDHWGEKADKAYAKKQWLLSKWEVCEGIEWSQEKIDIMLESIVAGLDLKTQHQFVDLGCGGGWITHALTPVVKNAIGLDFSYAMLQMGKQAFPLNSYICGEIGRLPFRNETWDRILSYFVFLNFMDDDFIKKAILDIIRTLKKDGRILIGQLPDQRCSGDYDQAKKEYLQYCEEIFTIGKSNRDICRAPQKLFDKEMLTDFFKQEKILFEFRPSFNPFFRKGQPETVDWRFDIILTKK